VPEQRFVENQVRW